MSKSDDRVEQKVTVARRLDNIRNVVNKANWKIKNTELTKGDLQALRMADCIEKSDFQMGKECLWTVTDECKEILDSIEAEKYQKLTGLSKEAEGIISSQKELFKHNLPTTTEKTFYSNDVSIQGRTPGALREHGIIEIVERKKGYSTKWKMTEKGVQTVELVRTEV